MGILKTMKPDVHFNETIKLTSQINKQFFKRQICHFKLITAEKLAC